MAGSRGKSRLEGDCNWEVEEEEEEEDQSEKGRQHAAFIYNKTAGRLVLSGGGFRSRHAIGLCGQREI